MAEIELTMGYIAIVDDDRFEELSKFKWCARDSGWGVYAGRGQPFVYLHRFLIGAMPGQIVDHKNGDSLDNRVDNLRFCTTSQNAANTNKNKLGISGLKGVTWDKSGRKWSVRLRIGHSRISIGRFNDKEEAYRAYCKAVINHYGQFARVS